ncbi:MAG: energy transducer TonB [bacterium]
MNELENTENQLPFLVDSPQPDTGGLLRTGVFSLLLHLALISLLIFNLKTGTTRDKLPVYRVAIQPLSLQNDSKPLLPKAVQPTPAKPQIQKEEIKSKEQVKQLTKLKEDDQTIQKPIPLPMAETSDLKTDSKPEEEILPIPNMLSYEEKNASAKPGTGIGSGGTPGGVGEGGTGGAGWSSIGKGTGVERGGGSGLHGSGFVGSGKGSAGGRGRGRGDSGTGSPRYAQNPKPPYPQEARDKGYQGRVLLEVEVLANGKVGDIFVKQSSGYDVLDQCALETVKKWTFIPAMKGNVPITMGANIPITFQIKDASF